MVFSGLVGGFSGLFKDVPGRLSGECVPPVWFWVRDWCVNKIKG